VGTAFIEAYGREITGRFVDEIDLDDQRDFILADYLGVVRTKEPSLSHWRYTKRDGRFVRYSRLLLPLSRDDSEIDMLLGAVTAQGFAGCGAVCRLAPFDGDPPDRSGSTDCIERRPS
jgi:hypothetical protein